MSAPGDRELQEWIAAYCDGRIGAEDFSLLETRLREDPEARRLYRRYLNLDAALQDSSEDEESQAWQSPGNPAHDRKVVTGPWVWGLGTALAAALALSLILIFARSGAGPEPAETMAEGFAILTETVDLVWGTPSEPGAVFRRGDTLAAEHLRFESGLAQIEFFGGATVILEGQVDFEIVSPTEAFLHGGRLRATAPPAARGFIIRTPDIKVVDLGTEFAIDSSAGRSEIHVLDGEVEFEGADGNRHRAVKGEAFAYSQDQTAPQSIPADAGGFTGVADLDQRSQHSAQKGYERWAAFSQKRRQDPRLITYYAFDEPGTWDRVLRNSQAPRNPEQDGAIVGAMRFPGRWDYPKSALEFKRTGSRVRVFIPGEFTSLTFTCWARVDSLDRKYNALFLADNYQPGEPHWQFQEDGRLMYSMKIREEGKMRNYIYYTPPVWDISLSGQWMHLAAVFDASTQTVIQYVNGKEVSRERAQKDAEVHTTRIGAGEIGNWGLPTKDDPWFAVRNLNGAIDEFAIYSAALEGAEIREIFEQGTPY